MIKVILKGGLGNQMFQYAAGKALALDKKTDLFLDLTHLKTRPPIPGFTIRNYELYLFDVPEKTGTLLNNNLLDKYFSYTILLIFSNFFNKNYFPEGPDPYEFDNRFFKLNSDTTLEGYWNNPKYFAKYDHEIRKMFDLGKFYDSKYDTIESSIKNKNSVAINIRRGDYLNNRNKNVFVTLREEYYKKAISLIRSKVKNPRFFVFSYDDPKWFENTFKMNPDEYTMMGNEYIGEKFKTYLRLISLCKHNIISNSTFAWWGAYLNKNPDKLVISPKQWTRKYSFDTPPGWIAL